MIGRNDSSAQWGASFVVIAVERAAEARICAASNATRRVRLRKAQSGRSCLIVSTCRLRLSVRRHLFRTYKQEGEGMLVTVPCWPFR